MDSLECNEIIWVLGTYLDRYNLPMLCLVTYLFSPFVSTNGSMLSHTTSVLSSTAVLISNWASYFTTHNPTVQVAPFTDKLYLSVHIMSILIQKKETKYIESKWKVSSNQKWKFSSLLIRCILCFFASVC